MTFYPYPYLEVIIFLNAYSIQRIPVDYISHYPLDFSTYPTPIKAK